MSKFHHGWTTSVGAFFRFEWGLDLTAMGNAAPKVGQIIGFEVAIGDRDTDGSFTWMGWGEGVGKLGHHEVTSSCCQRATRLPSPAGSRGRVMGSVFPRDALVSPQPQVG
ncbi:MAG: hypothetical protein CME05_08270 [Gemmatimonadaceae bacterium]|nr:hypothetical protein [Gemmatimonadaceae bacterium]